MVDFPIGDSHSKILSMLIWVVLYVDLELPSSRQLLVEILSGFSLITHLFLFFITCLLLLEPCVNVMCISQDLVLVSCMGFLIKHGKKERPRKRLRVKILLPWQALVLKVVSLAIARDGASGGVVGIVIINSEGVTRHFHRGDELPLWHEELQPQNSLLDILNAQSPEPMNI